MNPLLVVTALWLLPPAPVLPAGAPAEHVPPAPSHHPEPSRAGGTSSPFADATEATPRADVTEPSAQEAATELPTPGDATQAAAQGDATELPAQQDAATEVSGRKELLRQARLDKQEQVEQLPEEEDSGLRKLAAPFQALRDGMGGFRPLLTGTDPGGGFEFGVEWGEKAIGHRYTQLALPNRADVRLRALGSLSGYSALEARFDLLNVGGTPFNATFEGEYRRAPHLKFFGVGRDSRREDLTQYLLRTLRFGTSLWWDLPEGFRVGAGIDHISLIQGPGGDSDTPSVDQLFDPLELPGLGTRPSFIRFGGFADFDWRDLPEFPRSGGYYALRVYDYNDQQALRFEFRDYEVELQQYVPFTYGHRVLAFRFLGTFTDADDDEVVPFYLMPTLGGSHDLRGFRTFRFRDFNKMLLQSEYRWEAWIGLEMALFFDAGKVFPDRDHFDLDDLHTAYGVGFRFNNEETTFLRLDLAFGGEGFKPHASFSHVF